MTRRERLERKLELRREWSEKAETRAQARFAGVHTICDRIPFGQPILVGHHSERHARADQRRIENGMRKGCEESALAKRHEEKADGIARQLDRSVFSDDPDAIEQIEARIAEHTKTADAYATINKTFRKGGIEAVKAVTSPELVEKIEREMRLAPWQKLPFTYHLTNLRARIRSDQERIKTIRAQQQRTEHAAESGGVLIEGDTYVRVTFAEKPDRETLNALRAAGFRWGGGSWVGERAKLPSEIGR
jgi:uncharacterized protein DUF3560